MSDGTLRLAPARDDTSAPAPIAPARRLGATLSYLTGGTPLEEYERLGAEIADDAEKLRRKVETRAAIHLHLLLAGQLP